MDSELQHAIFNETPPIEAYPTRLYIYDSMVLFSCLLGLIGNVLIIASIARTKTMRSSTYIILMSWGVSNGISDLCAPLNYHLFQRMKVHIFGSQIAHCIFADTEVTPHLVTDIFVVIFISEYLMTLNIKYLYLIISGIFGLGFVFWVSTAASCLFGYSFSYMVYLALFLKLGILLAIIYKQICRYQSDNRLLRYRINLASIFIVNWAVSFACLLLSDFDVIWFVGFFEVIGYFNSLFILLYTVYMDVYFKISLLQFLRCIPLNSYNIDAAISFSREEEKGEPTVDIMVGETESIYRMMVA